MYIKFLIPSFIIPARYRFSLLHREAIANESLLSFFEHSIIRRAYEMTFLQSSDFYACIYCIEFEIYKVKDSLRNFT